MATTIMWDLLRIMRSSAAVTLYVFVRTEGNKVLLKHKIRKVIGFPLPESSDRIAVRK